MKFLSFKFIVILLIIILLFPVFIVSIFLVKNSVFPTWEGGNLSDWASTLCNLVMAISAVYAIIKAKDFLSAKLHSDAYELSKKIIVFQTNDLIFALTTSLRTCNKIKDVFNNIPLGETNRIADKLEELLDHISSIGKIQNDITSNLRVLNKLGFSMNLDCKPQYEEYIRNIDSFVDCVIDCSDTFLSIIKDSNNIEKIECANNEIEHLTTLHRECSQSHACFYYHKDGFFEYFTPRK